MGAPPSRTIWEKVSVLCFPTRPPHVEVTMEFTGGDYNAGLTAVAAPAASISGSGEVQV